MMDNYDLLQLLQGDLSKSTSDVKVEAQLAIALENGLTSDDFMVHCDSLFSREYKKDLLLAEIKEEASKLSTLQLHLTRSGVYDHLPEGLFFQPTLAQTKSFSAAEMALAYRDSKQKESEIRQFFLPFENDFFWQRLQLETEEAKLLEGLKSGILNDYFIRFWNLPGSIPNEFIIPLILLLPYASRITGNLSYTAQCLGHLLHEKVQVKRLTPPVSETGSACSQLFGSQQLGIDTVCGTQFMEDYTVLEFTLGPLENSQVIDYIECGKRFTLMQTFCNFFIPAGVDVSTIFRVAENKKCMQLQSGFEPILGYSSFLEAC